MSRIAGTQSPPKTTPAEPIRFPLTPSARSAAQPLTSTPNDLSSARINALRRARGRTDLTSAPQGADHRGDGNAGGEAVVPISPEVATILSAFQGACLKLNGLTDLFPQVAAILARFPKLLSLGGIKSLGTTTAKALAQHRGELMLDGLLYLPDKVAEAISQHEGTLLAFESWRFLSNGAAKALAGYRGKVEIPMVEMGVNAAFPNIWCRSS